jgi:NitT/TauT family transport system substrate-binding protein
MLGLGAVQKKPGAGGTLMSAMSWIVDRRKLACVMASGVALAASLAAAQAETVRIGKAVVTSFPFAGIELAQEAGIWKSVGLDVQITTFKGDGQLQQAFAAGAVDFGVGSGPGMGYAAKGVPAHAVASLADKPENMALVVAKDGPIKTIDDLKGKSIGVTTAGSLTDWLARKLAETRGWGGNGVKVVPLGDFRARLAAMQSGDLSGNVTATEQAYQVRNDGLGRVLFTFGDIVPDFHTHVIFASDPLIKKNPDLVKRFLKGWFLTVKYMQDHRPETVKSVAHTMDVSEKVVDEVYDIELGMMSRDGKFNPKALETIRASLKDLGILDFVPDVQDMFAPGFVPVKLD